PRPTLFPYTTLFRSSPDGAELAWNLVSGVNDPATESERAVWVDGAPSEAPPVSFDADLRKIHDQQGHELRFHAEAQRHRRENLLDRKSTRLNSSHLV